MAEQSLNEQIAAQAKDGVADPTELYDRKMGVYEQDQPVPQPAGQQEKSPFKSFKKGG